RLGKRGVRPIVTEREAGCDGRCWCADDVHRGVRSSRVVLIPRRWNQVNRDDLFATGANKPGTPRRARSNRKPIAQGVPDRFGQPVVTTCSYAAYPFLRARLRVRPAPGIPCALFISRDENDTKPGRESRRGNADV